MESHEKVSTPAGSERLGKPIGTIVAMPMKNTPSFSEAHAELNPGELVRPGELLLVEIKQSRVYSLARVEQGLEINPYEAPEMVHARTLLELDSISRREDMPRRYRLVLLDLVEEIVFGDDGHKIREPQSLIEAGSPVLRAVPEAAAPVLGILPPSLDGQPVIGLHVGETLGANPLPVFLKPNEVLSRHILVIGTTGGGKSWLRGVLSEEIKKLGIPQVSIDFHGESIQATEELGGVNLKPGESVTIKLSSLSEPEVLGFIPFLTELQGEIVRRAFLELKKEQKETNRDFDLADMVSKINKVGGWMDAKASTIESARSRTEMLRFVKVIGKGIDWASLLKPSSILNIDCRGLEHSELQAAAGGIARELLTLRIANKIPPLVLSVDEAHLFLPYSEDVPSSQVMRQVIRYGRHYGLGLMLITPSPMDIDRTTVRTTNTRFIFATEPDQLDALRGVFSDAPKEIIDRMPKLEQGTCLITGSKETVRHSFLLRVRQRETTHGGKTPDFVEEVKKFADGSVQETKR